MWHTRVAVSRIRSAVLDVRQHPTSFPVLAAQLSEQNLMTDYRGMSSSQAESDNDLQMDELGRKKLVAALICLRLNSRVICSEMDLTS